MSRASWMLILAAATVTGFSAPVVSLAGDVDSSANAVADLGVAAQLAAFGRGELNETTGLKDFKSPEALVAAGAILLRVHKQTGGVLKSSDAKVMEDEAVVPAEGSPTSLADAAEELFDEARALPTKDKAALEAQIKQAHASPDRGAIAGPQVINRTVKSGKTHRIHIAFAPNSPAAVAMQGTSRTKFEVIGNGGQVLWHSRGAGGHYHWHTGRGGVKDVTVRIINSAGPPVAYTVVTN